MPLWCCKATRSPLPPTLGSGHLPGLHIKKICLGCTDRQVLFALLGSSRWSGDLWLLTLQYLLLLAHTSGSTHHSQSVVVWESRVEGSTRVPQTFLCRRASAQLCYHKPRHSRVGTGLRHPRGRMGHVGGCSPSHIAVL